METGKMSSCRRGQERNTGGAGGRGLGSSLLQQQSLPASLSYAGLLVGPWRL